MDYRSLAKHILNKGKEKMDDLEVFIQKTKEVEIGIFNGEIDKYSISESGGLSLRGLHEGKMGYSYTEKVDETSIDMLIDEAFENSKYIDSLEDDIIFSGSDKYEDIINYNNLSNISMEDKISFLKKLEKESLNIDSRVSTVQMCVFQEFENERYIINTKGIDLYDKVGGGFCYISIIAKDGEDTKTGSSFRIFNDISNIDYKDMAKEAVEEGLSMLKAISIKSDNYPVIFKNTVFADIISAFTPIFSADNVQKGLSLLNNKIGTKVSNEILTIVDDPLLQEGFGSRSFDDEGVKTIYKKIIDKGILNSYFHNLKTAKKDGVESTGNGSRNSYKSSVSISPSNLYIEKGNKSLDELIKGIEKGIYITNVEGLHSGINTVSGDYSLSSYGYEIENGKIKRPVNQITIAGNLYETLMDVEEIGNDLKFGLPTSGFIGSPSIKVKKLSVSGR